jgi:hypothetical protein
MIFHNSRGFFIYIDPVALEERETASVRALSKHNPIHYIGLPLLHQRHLAGFANCTRRRVYDIRLLCVAPLHAVENIWLAEKPNYMIARYPKSVHRGGLLR